MTDVAEQLHNLLPQINMMPPVDDADLEDAILHLKPEERQYLDNKYGRHQVTIFFNDFLRNRRL